MNPNTIKVLQEQIFHEMNNWENIIFIRSNMKGGVYLSIKTIHLNTYLCYSIIITQTWCQNRDICQTISSHYLSQFISFLLCEALNNEKSMIQ